ncbi:hypothetical protein [Bradyrhizobium zhanjiangense]|nr:hypothetical protein [Bradyrhizobium zhanjiangense]
MFKCHVAAALLAASGIPPLLASLQAAVYLPQIWTPDAETERKRRLVARR